MLIPRGDPYCMRARRCFPVSGLPGITERRIGMGTNEKEIFEEDAGKRGFPRTRANMASLRAALNRYYETEGYRDQVIIRIPVRSYVPEIAINPAVAVPAIDSQAERMILGAKTALDGHTFSGATRAMEYLSQLLDFPENPRILANCVFLPFAVSPLVTTNYITRAHAETFISISRRNGFEFWEAIFSEACLAAAYDHDWQRSANLFEKALVASQQEAIAFWWYPALLASIGKIDKAIEILDSMVRHFAYKSISCRSDLAILQTIDRRYSEAKETLADLLQLAPASNPLVACSIVIFYEAQDQLDNAHRGAAWWIDKAINLGPVPTDIVTPAMWDVDWHNLLVGMIALVLGRANNRAGAQEYLDMLLRHKERKHRAKSCVEIAIAFIGLAQYDDAVEWLTRAAFEENDPYAMWFHIFPPLRHLRGHKGFKDLLKRLKLRLPRPC